MGSMKMEYGITKRGREKLEQELVYLRTTRSREVAAMLEEAKAYGDLTENAEYEMALREQKNCAGRIAEITRILSCAAVTEEECRDDGFREKLLEAVLSCGLSQKQAEAYADYCRELFEQRQAAFWGELPGTEHLETLKEAQRIVSEKPDAGELDCFEIDSFLRIPCRQWQAAKCAIAECFGCGSEAVEALYREDAQWLTVTPEAVKDLTEVLKKTLGNDAIAWKVFPNAALLGAETAKDRFAAVLELLGEEAGKKVLRADAEQNIWFLYRYYSDPVGAVAYMKSCGLAPETILTVVRQDPDILYFYKEGRKLSYCHNQEVIDKIIRKYQ